MTYDAAIAGAGFSGTMVAYHLARIAPQCSVVAFEPAQPGLGAAYATRCPQHLLNTRAAAMSALPGEPEHFVRWLNGRATPHDFVPRALYGAYLSEFARAAFERGGARIVRERVVEIRRDGDAYEVGGSEGTRLRARTVVLAAGNAAPDADALPRAILRHPGYVGDPWRCDYASMRGRVLLIGSGLTALDVLVALAASGHRDGIDVVSRGGHFPAVHLDPLPPLDAVPALDASSARALLRSFRRCEREARERGQDWRAVVDALRPECEVLWNRLPPSERHRFDRRLRSFWERHRHRAPQAADAARAGYAASGLLHVYAGRLSDASEGSVTVRKRDGETLRLFPQWIVNCTGPARGRRLFADPLLAGMVQRGLVVPEPLGLGIELDGDLRVVGAEGAVVPGLFAVGPLARGSHFEATAVPELRGMALSVAEGIAGALKKGVPSDRGFLEAEAIL